MNVKQHSVRILYQLLLLISVYCLSIDCVDKRKKCQVFASIKNYCTYQSAFMRRNCPKSCQFCEKVRHLYDISPRNVYNFMSITEICDWDMNACVYVCLRISHNHAITASRTCYYHLLYWRLVIDLIVTANSSRQFQSDHWLKTPGLLFKTSSFFIMCFSIFTSLRNFYLTQKDGNAFITFRFCEDALRR